MATDAKACPLTQENLGTVSTCAFCRQPTDQHPHGERAAKSKRAIPVSGIWLRRRGDYAEVLAEVDGTWRLLFREVWDGNYSHIVEPLGIEKAPKDDL